MSQAQIVDLGWFWFSEINLVCGLSDSIIFLEEVRRKSSRKSMMRSLNISVKDTIAINFICNMHAYESLYLLGCCKKVKTNYTFVMMSLKF